MESTLQSNLNNLITFRNSQDDVVHGTLLKLTRTSLVFEVYNPYSIVQLSEVLNEVTISRGDRPIYEGRAVVSNLVNTGLMLIVSTTLVDPWTELFDLKPGPSLQKEVRHFIDEWDSNHQRLDPEYNLSLLKSVIFYRNSISGWSKLKSVQVYMKLIFQRNSQIALQRMLKMQRCPALISYLMNLMSRQSQSWMKTLLPTNCLPGMSYIR